MLDSSLSLLFCFFFDAMPPWIYLLEEELDMKMPEQARRKQGIETCSTMLHAA